MDFPRRIPDTRLAQAKVLVMGDVMLDRYWFGDVNRISPEAPVPIALIRREEHRLGGAANVARNIPSLGGQANLIGVVGGDESGSRLEKLLAEDGVHSRLVHDPSIATILKLRVIGHNQQLLRIDFENFIDQSHLSRMEENFVKALADTDIVVLSDYGKGALAHVATLIKTTLAHQRPVLVDPKGNDYERYRGATILTPNRSELKAVIGDWDSETTLHQRAQNLRRALDWKYLLLTRSEEGMTLFSDEGALTVPAQAREVFDVSGAGDTVIASLALMLACGLDTVSAMTLANRAAGIAVAKFGTATVSTQELWQFEPHTT